MTRCRPDVDAVVGIDRVGDELLVLLIPDVEVVPWEGHVIVEIRRAGGWLNWLDVAQPVPANVIAREEIASERAVLMEQLRSPAVDHRLAAALRTNPSRRGIDEEHLRHRDFYVEATGGSVSERAGAHGEGHAGHATERREPGPWRRSGGPILGPHGPPMMTAGRWSQGAREASDVRGVISTQKGAIMPRIEIDGLAIHYDVQGEGEPLLLIPYLSADHACYAFQLPAYTEHFSCIALDLPGSGDSDKPAGP